MKIYIIIMKLVLDSRHVGKVQQDCSGTAKSHKVKFTNSKQSYCTILKNFKLTHAISSELVQLNKKVHHPGVLVLYTLLADGHTISKTYL